MSSELEKSINQMIAAYRNGANGDFSTNNISDGYHTFGELYDHRHDLFIALVNQFPDQAWRFSKNHDGVGYEGYFGLGLFPEPGKQITFHLPNKYLPMVVDVPNHLINPHYDGHTSKDIFSRLAGIPPIWLRGYKNTLQFDIPNSNPENIVVTLGSNSETHLPTNLKKSEFEADAALVLQNQKLAATNRRLDNELTQANALIEKLENQLARTPNSALPN